MAGLPAPPRSPDKVLPAPLTLGEPLNLPEGPQTRIEDPSGKFTGNYDSSIIRSIIDSAKQTGVDPMTALAMSGQESTFGRFDPQNPLRIQLGLHNVPSVESPVANQALNIHEALKFFKNRGDRQRVQTPEDEELIIQSYNGLGPIHGGSEVAQDANMYGDQIGLHGGRDRPYGKAVMSLRDMLSQQPNLQKLIK